MKLKYILFITASILITTRNFAYAQVCATPGADGSSPVSGQVNTYYPVATNTTLNAGSTTITLTTVPADIFVGTSTNTYSPVVNGLKEYIKVGDLLLIIQMQDATINASDNNLYGANSSTSGPDGLGGTGYTSLGNTGLYEYVVATNTVPLTGGILSFRGFGSNNGVVNTYYNYDFNVSDLTRGKRSFQIVRVPQYSNVMLTANISAPPFNGNVGGIIAFDVAGTINFNNQTINANERGFRGGYTNIQTSAGCDVGGYIALSSNTVYATSGKGESIVGTPKNMWDGFIQVVNSVEGLPNGSYGRGAPGNGGGGGNSHNAGGGGGGNGGYGGLGGAGVGCSASTGGRPGYITGTPTPTRIFMGGGGGAGEVNDANKGTSGGVGGGIVLLNVGKITGSGTITVNGGDGQNAGWDNGVVNDGGAGAGAGGTAYVKVSNPDITSSLIINAKGGAGGKASLEADQHGPGGGGGGGKIFYSTGAAGTIVTNVAGGASGTTTNGTSTHVATAGSVGQVQSFAASSLPGHLQGGGSICYPELTVALSETNVGTRMAGAQVTYTLTISNKASVGNAAGVVADLSLPSNMRYASVTVTYNGGSGGDGSSTVTTNQGTLTSPRFGNFVVAPGGSVVLTLRAIINCNASTGTYNTSAQVYYLDPTRNANPLGRISPSPAIFAFPTALSVSTFYESGGSVSGTNFNGLSSTADDVNVTDGVPTLSSPLYTGAIQSGSLFNYVPASNFVLPSSVDVLTFSWSRPAVSGISNTPASGTYSISETLFNTTTSAIEVGYSYTLAINGCPISVQTVTTTVNPSVLTILASPAMVNAGDTSVVSVSLPSAITAATTITLSFTQLGNAISDTHYVGSSLPLSVTIPMGQNGVSFTLITINTNTIGLSTTLGLTGTLLNYQINGTSITIVDITGDNLANRVVNIGSVSITEGLSSTLTVSLTSTIRTAGPLTVTLASSAAFPTSYTANDGRGVQSISGSTSLIVVIPANSNSVSVSIQTALDGQLNTHIFALSGTVSALSYTVNPGTITVFNKDVLTPTLSILAGPSLVGSMVPVTVTTTSSFTNGGSISLSMVAGSGSGTLSSFNLTPISGTISLTFTALQAGSITLVATSAGDTNYYGVSSSISLVISKVTPTLQFSSLSNTMLLGASQTVSATSTIGLVDQGGGISYTVTGGSGSATVDQYTGFLTAIRAGSVTLTATMLGNSNYYTSSTSTVITIGKITPTLILSAPAVLAVGSTTSVITNTTAVFSSGGNVTFTVIGGGGSATVSNTGVVTALSFGTVTLQAQALGDSNYFGSTTSTLMSVVAGPQTLTITSANSLAVSTSLQVSISTTALASNGGAITYTIMAGSGSASVSSSGLIQGIQSGAVTLSVSISGDTNYTATSTHQLLTIVPGTQQLIILGSSTVPVGENITILTSRNVLASKGGALSFTVSTGSGSASIGTNTGLLTGIRVGTVLVTVTALGNSAYYSPISATLSVTVSLGSQSLSVNNQPLLLVVGDSLSLSITRSVSSTFGGLLSYVVAPGSGSATIDINGHLTSIYAGGVSVTVQAFGNTNYYGPVSLTIPVSIARGTPTLSVSSTSLALTVGDRATLSAWSIPPFAGGVSSTGSISYSIISGMSNVLLDVSTGSLTAIRAGLVVVRSSQGADNNYYATVAPGLTLTIGPSTPSLSLSTTTGFPSLSVGESLTITSQSVLPNGATIPSTGAVVYHVLGGSGSGTINANTGKLQALSSGTVIVQAVQGSDTNYYASTVASLTLSIGAGSQTLSITSTNGSYTTWVEGSITLTASSNVVGGGSISYGLSAGSGSATINATTGLVTGYSVGTVIVTAYTGGNANYYAASVSQTVTITKGSQSLSISPSISNMFAGSSLTFTTTSTATGGRGGAVTYSVSNGTGLAMVHVNTGNLTAIAAGTITLTVYTGGDSDYNPAQLVRSLTISKNSQVLTVTSVSKTSVGGSLTLSISTTANLSSGGTLSHYIVSSSGGGIATIDPTTGFFVPKSVGVISLATYASGDTNYNSAYVMHTITIGKATPVLSLTAVSTTLRVGDSLSLVGASTIPSGGISNSSSMSYQFVSGNSLGTLNSNTGLFTALGSGEVVIQVVQGSDTNYDAPVPASITLSIGAGPQTLSITSANVMNLNGTLTATVVTSAGAQGGSLSFSLEAGSGSATIDPFTHVITGLVGGTVTLTASISGDANYTGALTSQLLTIVTVSLSSNTSTLKEGAQSLFTLSLSPSGVTYSSPLSFDLSGIGTSDVQPFSFPPIVTIAAGTTSTTFPVTALHDGVLFNTRVAYTHEITSDVGLTVAPISITVVDATADDPSNLILRIGRSTIYRSGTELLSVSYPPGITSVEPLTVTLSSNVVNGLITYNIPTTASIEAGNHEVLVEISASNADNSVGVISVSGVSLNPLFNAMPGSVTVLNSRIRVVRALSNNGDGINDCLVIENIENFPNRVSIMDRNGMIVFYTENYRNDCGEHSFTGKRNKCPQWNLQQNCNENLSSGPYYYQIEIIDQGKSDKTYSSFQLK